MAFDAKVIRVMIASPGDVGQERQFVRDAIHSWNDLNAEQQNCVLLPVGWETHSAPALGDRPQQLINERVLDSCDLLVGVFWTRLGTPTGEAASGTVEEIERHLQAGKPAMVYFSQQPAAPDSVDATQYAALKEFREWCIGKGLVSFYENPIDFRNDFATHLQINLRDDPYLRAIQRSPQKVIEGDTQIADSEDYYLSAESKKLLTAAIQDPQGIIMMVSTFGGDIIQTNRINFAEGADARGRAAWRGAVEQLQFNMLIEDRGGKQEVFYLTDDGYRYGEILAREA